jgi:hypothetical protein
MSAIVAARTPGLFRDPRRFVWLKKLGDFAITYELNVYCRHAQAIGRLYTALHRNILDVSNKYGVQIMTPAYENDPHTPKVVARQDWYAPPARQADAAPNPAGLRVASKLRRPALTRPPRARFLPSQTDDLSLHWITGGILRAPIHRPATMRGRPRGGCVQSLILDCAP